MVCVGLLTTIRISGTAALRGWVVVYAELGSGIAGWGFDSVSAPGVAVLGIWDSEPVWALAGKASIAPKAATLSKRQSLIWPLTPECAQVRKKRSSEPPSFP